LIEYAFLGCAIALAAIAGAELLGTTLNNWYSTVAGTTDAGGAKAISISF
jgi:Flp pilus assembly pilin Flp